MDPLSELAIKYGTDKSPLWHNYTPTYWRWMCGTERETEVVVDIGVMNGASTRMWLDFFPKATIYAIDKDLEAFNRLSATNHPGLSRVVPLHGNESSEILWSSIPNAIDYVIDDGSHIPENQMSNFLLHFCKLLRGGLWIIEDTHCNFHVNFNGTFMGDDRLYPWLSKIITEQQMGGGEAGNFYKAVESLDNSDLRKQIFGITSYKSIIIFEHA